MNRRERAGPVVAVGLAFLAGALLRLWHLGDQLLLGDELHAVRTALDWDLPRILTNYRLADNSIPLTAFYRLLVESGVVLGEPLLRLPSVLAGLALLVALPWVAGRELGGRTAVLAAWLAAISPALVYYTRIARPYAVTTVLCLAAVACFWQWWERGGRWWWALAYCVAGAGAAWFHLGAAPLVAAPLLFAAMDVGPSLAGRSPDSPERLRRLLLAAAGLVALVASFLVPAGATFLRLLRVRPGDGSLTLESVLGTFALQAGTGRPWLAVLFWATALTGLVLLSRRRRRLALYWACAVGVQWAAIALLLRPSGVAHEIVLNRYLLPTLPFVLLWVASGLDGMDRRLQRLRVRGAGAVAPFLFLLALLSGGPYPREPGLYFGSFAGSNDAMNFLEELAQVPADRIPAVYRVVAREPGREPVLEAPRHTAWWRNLEPLAYSRVHGRRVVIGSTDRHLEDPRLRLRNVVPLDPSRLAESGARFVIVDLDPRRAATDPPSAGRPSGEIPETPEAMRAEALVRRLEEEWGGPTLVDGPLRLWDLSRSRWLRR